MSVTTVIQALDDLVDPVGLKAAQVKTRRTRANSRFGPYNGMNCLKNPASHFLSSHSAMLGFAGNLYN
jgi:hypothetical protein